MRCPVNYKNSIINVPGTIAENLGLEWKRKFDISLGRKIVWIIVDGLGYYEFRRKRFLFKALKKFKIKRICSVLPSSTVPALSSLYTGLTPQEHGFLEWFIYDREKKKQISVFTDKDYKISDYFSGKTVFEELSKEKKVKVFLKKDYYKGRISKRFFKGCERDFYLKTSDLLAKIIKSKDYDLIFAYYDFKDIIDHYYGKGLEMYFELKILNKFFDKISKKDFSIVICADHGLYSPTKYVYLSKMNLARSIENFSGLCRSLFLFTKKDIYEDLKEKLGEHFVVEKSINLFEEGWFGIGKAQKNFKKIIGDIAIMSKSEYCIWIKKAREFVGMHGGITREEIFVPLIWRE